MNQIETIAFKIGLEIAGLTLFEWITLTISVVGLVGTALGTIGTIHYGKKSSRLEREKRRLQWDDIHICAYGLKRYLENEQFLPEVVYTPSLRGGALAHLVTVLYSEPIPIVVGNSFQKNDIENYSKCKPGKTITKGSVILKDHPRWQVEIPMVLGKYKSKKLLIIDDMAMSGDFLQKLKQAVVKHGFSEADIKTATVACTEVAKSNGKAPDYHWHECKDSNFFFPWGKAI